MEHSNQATNEMSTIHDLNEDDLKIYNETLDEVHKQKFLEAHATGFPEAIQFVLYEFLLATIPATMPKAQQDKHRKALKRKMAECMKKCQAAAKKYEEENWKMAEANWDEILGLN